MEAFIAIGDIHGCPDPLLELLEKTRSYPGHKLVFLGDYIDRGPDDNRVIEILAELEAIFIRGNHEQMLIETMECIEEPDQALRFLEMKGISEENYRWLRENTRFAFDSDRFIFSHAGLNPEKAYSEQDEFEFLWFAHDGGYRNEERTVVHGHVSGDSVRIVENNINVDTGCGKDGFLSGIVLPENIILRSDSRGYRAKLV